MICPKVIELLFAYLDALMEHIGLSSKPKVIDLSSKRGVVQTLNEVKVSCSMEEKDIYLYDVLLNMPGRTLVFCNSKDSVRRLAAVLSLLIQPAPLTLHADMHQKQRLKFLDRFAGTRYLQCQLSSL
jgi:ATP-dependent RNA helicase DDX24/MAK5